MYRIPYTFMVSLHDLNIIHTIRLRYEMTSIISMTLYELSTKKLEAWILIQYGLLFRILFEKC